MKYQDAPLLGKRVRAKDGTEGTIVEVGETPKHRLTMFHVRTDDGREAALFSHEFDVLEANAHAQQPATGPRSDTHTNHKST